MPQQVQLSPTPPESGEAVRSQREREMRVLGDAGAFGMLLGALQSGEAGIVRGEARNDSAAEWNAKDAREGRQQSRAGAQALAPQAQDPRGALERLVGRQSEFSSLTVATPSSEGDEAPPPTDGAAAKAERKAPEPMPQHAGTNVQRATPVTQGQSWAAVQASAAPVAAAVIASAGTALGASGVPSPGSQGVSIEAARGPQGGAARGRAPASASPNADRALRFEKVFEAQVGRGLAQALKSGEGTVTLRLRPQNLGQLNVRVAVEDQRVTATFEARSAEAQRLLEGSRDALRLQLETRGLQVERIDVRLVDEGSQAGTRFADVGEGGADRGQDGQSFGDREGRGSSRGDGSDGGSHRGAAREDDEPVAGAEPWRALGTVRLNAIA